MKLFGQGGVFDFTPPDFDYVNKRLDRLNEIEDATDYSSIPLDVDLTDEQERIGRELLNENWEIYKELEGKVVCVDVEADKEEERPWWNVW